MSDIRDLFTIGQARYSKGNVLIQPTRNESHTKGRAERLLGALNCRYTNREHGYVCSPSKAKKFEKLLADGWDASYGGELESPEGTAPEKMTKKERETLKLRELVRTFVLEHGGTEETFGSGGSTLTLPTKYGPLHIPNSLNSVGTVFAKFDASQPGLGNPVSGKWNLHTGDRDARSTFESWKRQVALVAPGSGSGASPALPPGTSRG
jgi:hypothetical protein